MEQVFGGFAVAKKAAEVTLIPASDVVLALDWGGGEGRGVGPLVVEKRIRK
jgi:hypothetical protein